MLSPIYTIGHGSRKEEVFLGLLKKFGIRFLIDVRSMPYSRFHSQFNRRTLQEALDRDQIRYVFMGDELGGRPGDKRFYQEGKPDYAAIAASDHFRAGILRLKKAAEQELPVAIMCSERVPADCHRSRLIAPALEKEKIQVLHINEKGELESHSSVMRKIALQGS